MGPSLNTIQWALRQSDPNRSVTDLKPQPTRSAAIPVMNAAYAAPVQQPALPVVSASLSPPKTKDRDFGPQAVSVPDQEAYPLGRFPKANEWAAGVKEQNPLANAMFGGVLDFTKNVGTPRLSAKNVAAAGFDVMPWGTAIAPYGAFLRTLPVVPRIATGVVDNFIPNPFQE